MSPIKFRAKSQLDGKWVYGDFQRERFFDKSGERFFYSIGVTDENDWTCQRKVIPVFEQTIGQFTGLYDKNGKEIYENDIVKAKYIEKRDFGAIKYDNEMEFNELVVWKYQAFQLEIDNCGIKMYRHLNFYEDLNNIKLKELEVIGNIFDNPELLGEQQ